MAFENWDKLLYGIHRGQCVVFLGPELPMVDPDGNRIVPASALATRLQVELGDEYPGTGKVSDLPKIVHRFLSDEDEFGLEMELNEWHSWFRDQQSALHDDLAALPFRVIVNGSHDALMETALSRAGKKPSVDRYHFEGKNNELLPEASPACPTLYHLYGRVEEYSSLVLTETRLLDYLTAIISGEPDLPKDLKASLKGGKLFLFLGFGLQQWYLRILLRVMEVLRKGSSAYAVESLLESGTIDGRLERRADRRRRVDDNLLFYENFRVQIQRQDVHEFATELRERYVEKYGEEAPAANGDSPSTATGREVVDSDAPTVFLCHASEDKDTAREIHDTLKRNGLQPWLDQEALRGGDQWDDRIESTIKDINYFVVLNSESLRAKSLEASYVNKEIKVALKAEEWRMGKFIIPVQIDESPLLSHLEKYHAVNLAGATGMTDLVRAIKRQQQGA